MLRPLRKANAETRRVLNKALKTEAHSPLCKLYIYIYIYIYTYLSQVILPNNPQQHKPSFIIEFEIKERLATVREVGKSLLVE